MDADETDLNDDAMNYGGGVLEYCMEKNVGVVDCSVSCNSADRMGRYDYIETGISLDIHESYGI